MNKAKLAPKKIFNQILRWSVIATFDLIIECEDKGIFILKRTNAPYKNQWALPGLRILKSESIDDTLGRIAKDELGLKINTSKKILLGQYVGKFKTENNRQDLSTCYVIKIKKIQKYKINPGHFSDYKIINSKKQIPKNIGAMYKYYLNIYFN
jgi:hypothetical protein